MGDEEVAAALAQERHNIAELLKRAVVPYGAAENLVVEALLEWDAADRKVALIELVDSRCREYARKRGRSYFGLKETRAAIRKARAARGANSRLYGRSQCRYRGLAFITAWKEGYATMDRYLEAGGEIACPSCFRPLVIGPLPREK